MDSKPPRPVRPLRIHNENKMSAAATGKTAIQPLDKLASASSSVGGNVAIKAAAKRTAFADVSNTTRNALRARDAGTAANKDVVMEKKDVAAPVQEETKPTAKIHPPQRLLPSAEQIPTITNGVAPTASTTEVVIQSTNIKTTILEQVPDRSSPPSSAIFTRSPETTVAEGHSDTVDLESNLSEEDVRLVVQRDASELTAATDDDDSAEQEKLTVNMRAAEAAASVLVEDKEPHEDAHADTKGYTVYWHERNANGTTTVSAFRSTFTRQDHRELLEAEYEVDANRSPEEIEDEAWDSSMVADYDLEIFSYLRDIEKTMLPDPLYMECQTELSWPMRAELLDWVVQVHQRLQLLPETLFLAVNYTDRFLTQKVVSMGKLQLVAVTAILLAAKYEEIDCPSVAELAYMTDNAYTIDEILKAERFMLTMLQFELGWPGPLNFLQRISKADSYHVGTRTLAKYFLEVAMMYECFIGCAPSFLAAGAYCLARYMGRDGGWSRAHVHWSGYTLPQLHFLMSALLECCSNLNTEAAVFTKYADRKYMRVSRLVEKEIQRGFDLPWSIYDRSFDAKSWPQQPSQ